jgi:thymidylate kinase
MTRQLSSDLPKPGPQPRGRLIVLEGMPGGGKTSLARALHAHGARVLGEYTAETGNTVPLDRHPAVSDDDAHQQNWLRKSAQAATAGASGRPVYADRDWLSSVAYAFSVAGRDDAALLRHRTAWALTSLGRGSLLLPDVYMIFDIDTATSLHRRSGRLRPGHPWNHPEPLERLRRFYADPAGAVALIRPGLAGELRRPAWQNVSGLADPQHILQRLLELAGLR